MQKKGASGLQRLLNATRYSMRGLKTAWHGEAAFRQEVLLVVVLLPAAFWLGTSALQKGLLVFSLLMILVVELLNSAIETAIDRIGPEEHRLSGYAKDMGSAAVLVILAATAATWALVAWERWSSRLL